MFLEAIAGAVGADVDGLEELWSDERQADPQSLVSCVNRLADSFLVVWVTRGELGAGKMAAELDALTAIVKDSKHPDVKRLPTMLRMAVFAAVNQINKQKEVARERYKESREGNGEAGDEGDGGSSAA